jgi:LAO/AO transport system kinase
VETVGVGQDEVDIVKIVHSAAVVNIPGAGDSIQTMKAGILETGDIFIVNKADKPGADQVADQLQTMLQFRRPSPDQWNPPVIKTVALQNKGVNSLVQAFLSHKQYLINSGELDQKKTDQQTIYFQTLITSIATKMILNKTEKSSKYRALKKKLAKREIDPVSAAQEMVYELSGHQEYLKFTP